MDRMRPILIYKVLALGGNFFYASFYNINIRKASSCYMFNDTNHNTNVLNAIIDKCILIGCGNYTYDDILLNYIRYHGVVNTKELYSLSEVILKKRQFGEDLKNDSDIEFYMKKAVTSLDMNAISFFENTSAEIPLNYDTRKHVLEEDLVKIFDYVEESIENYQSVLYRLKRALNDGFKKKIEIPSSELAERRYVELMLGL
jgi:hypothetical protein